ncbi:MAG: pentapeptide repeat-containing protein [Saprospiraceae bacterium]|nr:pentapeptide repeat-containing protein [Saprospiraceae bacterium]
MSGAFIGTWFTNSNLSGAVFTDANLGTANFQGAKGITVEQLQVASSLVGTMGMPDSIVLALKQKKPSLFENIISPPSQK